MQPYARQIDSITKFRFGMRRWITNYDPLRRRFGTDSQGITMSTTVSPAPLKLASWRTPWVLIAIGCAIALIAFGPRSAVGQFLTPLSFERGWGREAFSFAIALQNLLLGAAQPFAGAVADRFGPVRVLSLGALLYAAGLAWMSQATTIAGLDLSAGVLIGFGL